MTYENLVILLGNVGREPEFQGLQNGGLVARFSLATSTGGFTTKDGREIPKVTQWHNIVCWDKNAEYVQKYVRKGAFIYVRGMLKYDTYTNEQGLQVHAAYIDASMLTLTERRQQAAPLPGDVPVSSLPRM